MVEVALLVVHGGYDHLQYVHPDEGISESHPYNKVNKVEGKEPARIPKKILPTSSSVTSEVKGNGIRKRAPNKRTIALASRNGQKEDDMQTMC